MKDHYTAFVQYSKKFVRTFEELQDKRLRQIHNRAMTGLHKLKCEMFVESDKCSDLILSLLKHEDENVRISAGAYCIQAETHTEEGRTELQTISENGSTRYIRFSAEQCLRYCKPFDTESEKR